MVSSAAWPGILRFIGGVALFGGGLITLRRALLGLASGRVQSFLARWTGSRWQAATAGLLAATFLQSSSLANLMIVNLVHARWLTLPTAVAMILGANVGTTTTAQLMSLSSRGFLSALAPAAILLWIVGRGSFRRAGMALSGLAAVLAGIGWLGDGMAGWVSETGAAERWFAWFQHVEAGSPLWPYIAGGALLTFIVQSSSVTIGMSMALASAGSLTSAQGMAFMLGANVGTVGSTLMGAVGASRRAQQAAWADLLFNAAGVLLAWPLVSWVAEWLAGHGFEPARQIALAHALFNASTVLLGLAFLDALVWVAGRAAPGRGR